MALTYLLDTNTVSYFLRNQPSAVRAHIDREGLAAACISSVTEGELRYGLARKPSALKAKIAVEAFLANCTVLPWDSAAAYAYGLVRAAQEKKGKPLSAEDLMLAAHALSRGLTLVTSDHVFGFVDGLRTEDWTVPPK